MNRKYFLENKVIPTIEKVYFKRPISQDGGKYSDFTETSNFFVDSGANLLQIISERGGKEIERVKNEHPLLKIIGGGNINSIEKATVFLNNQSDYLVIGGLFARKPQLIKSWVKIYGLRLVISIDDSNGVLVNNTGVHTTDFVKLLQTDKVKNVIYVSDNTKLIGGINLNRFKTIRNVIKDAVLIYSGGISHLDDLRILKKNGADSVIMGTALYRKEIGYSDAQRVFCH